MSRVGEEKCNSFGSKMKIINYRSSKDIDVYFEDYNYIYEHTSYGSFKKGMIKCPYEPRVCNIGYIGDGKYKSEVDGKRVLSYVYWRSMIRRCYDEKTMKDYHTYEDCKVCDEWHNFQNFAKWYEENYYEIDGEKRSMCLDKDILYKGNKIYSPQTCIFVPQRINTLILTNDNSNNGYPIGISYHKAHDKLMVRCSIGFGSTNKRKHLGYFELNEVEEAFQCYKKFKENHIKQVADEYKPYIPQRLYDALYKWEVNIDD